MPNRNQNQKMVNESEKEVESMRKVNKTINIYDRDNFSGGPST